jgi:two-component system sensor histidine kinase/response regulator
MGKLLSLLSLKTTAADGYHEKMQIKLYNSYFSISLLGALLFFLLNVLDRQYFLAATNLVTCLTCSGIMYCIYTRTFGRVYWLSNITQVINLSAVAVLYHNNLEYYLILTGCLNVLMIRNRRQVWLFSIAMALLFIVINCFIGQRYAIGDAGTFRRTVNMVAWAVSLVSFLYFYHSSYSSSMQELQVITHHLQHEQLALRMQNKTLEKLNLDKRKLFSIIAHDMRSPLHTLSASLDIFREDALEADELKLFSHNFQLQLNQLQTNLDNLLLWSYSQMDGGMVRRPVVFSMQQLICRMIGFLQQGLDKKGLTVQTVLPQELYVYADENQTEVVFRNLLSNAQKFSHVGGVIETGYYQHDDRLMVYVRDNGTGIAKQHIPNIFRNGVSLSGTLQEKGTGLGLSLCKEFIEQNGGRLTFTTREGKGSCFYFELPLAPAPLLTAAVVPDAMPSFS